MSIKHFCDCCDKQIEPFRENLRLRVKKNEAPILIEFKQDLTSSVLPVKVDLDLCKECFLALLIKELNYIIDNEDLPDE